MGIKSAWNAGMKYPSFFLPAVLIVAVSVGTLALELVFQPKAEISGFRATMHEYRYGENAPPLELSFKEKYPYRAPAIALCVLGSLFLGYFSFKAEHRLRKSPRLSFWDAFFKEIQAVFNSRSEFSSRDWNATDARLAIKELEREIPTLEAKNDQQTLAAAHWKMDYLCELLTKLESKEKSTRTPEDTIVESIGGRLRRKFGDLAELYALQAQIANEYKVQLASDPKLRKRVDNLFRREAQKIVGDEPEV